MWDRSISATRSPSKNAVRAFTLSPSVPSSLTTTSTFTITDVVTHSASSSNFLPGVGVNNPILYFRATFAFFANPHKCVPKALFVELPPMVWLAMVVLVWIVASSCGAKDPNRCLFPVDRVFKFQSMPVSSMRFMLAHHVYFSCVWPCHLRCATLHVLELLSHMSVSLLVWLAMLLAAPDAGAVNEGVMTSMSLFAVFIATAVRIVSAAPGWRVGSLRILRQTATAVELKLLRPLSSHTVERGSRRSRGTDRVEDYVEEIIAGPIEIDSDDELDHTSFPSAFDRKPPKPPREKSGLDIHDYVNSYVHGRHEKAAATHKRKQVVDRAFVEAEAHHVEQPPGDSDEDPRRMKDDDMGPQSLGISAAEFEQLAVIAEFPPDWLFDASEVEEKQEDDDTAQVIRDMFEPKGEIPRLSEHAEDEDEDAKRGILWKRVPWGPNWVMRSVVGHVSLWLVCFGLALFASSAVESRYGYAAGSQAVCESMLRVLAIQFVVWDLFLFQTVYAAWRGWRAGCWKCCCEAVLHFPAAGDDYGDTSIDGTAVMPLLLHPLY